MRLSRFNRYVPNAPDTGDVLVHNTLSGAYVVIDEDTMSVLRRADSGESLDSDEAQLIADYELGDPDVGVMVESYEAEEREFAEWFETRRASTDALDVLVSINRACNFDCPYCLQAGVMDGSVMKPDTADATADWIASYAKRAGVGAIVLGFAGGEPLLHPKTIRRVVEGVRARCDLDVTFKLITNGVFLTPERVDELAELGLVYAQVTLDGDETTHHLTRVSKRGENTFRLIFDNVIAASRVIQIGLNGNYQTNTVQGFFPLIRKLAEAGFPAHSKVSFSPALEGLDAPSGSGSGACTWSDSDTSRHVALYDEVLKRGFDASSLSAVGPCEFHDHHSFAIDPDGTIYKCPGFLAKPEWGIGHVTSGLIADRYREMVGSTPQRSCEGCAHRPNCGGGCVANAFIENGRAEGISCEKGFFERYTADALTRDFLLAASDSRDQALQQFPASPQPERSSPVRPAALRVISV